MYEEVNSNVKFIVRIRSPGIKDDSSNVQTNEDKIKANSKSVLNKSLPKTPQNPKNTKYISPMLKENVNYTIFTSSEPGYSLVISSKPISGRLINQTIVSETDITDFSHSIMKDATIMEFDGIYNETQK